MTLIAIAAQKPIPERNSSGRTMNIGIDGRRNQMVLTESAATRPESPVSR